MKKELQNLLFAYWGQEVHPLLLEMEDMKEEITKLKKENEKLKKAKDRYFRIAYKKAKER